MKSKNITITKAGLARELGITPARVSQLLANGLPALKDGSLDRGAALRWVAKYCSSTGGGWHFRGHDIAGRAQELLAGGKVIATASREIPKIAEVQDDLSARAILDRLFAGLETLPSLALHIGLPRCAAEAAIAVADAWMWRCIGEETLTRLYGDRGPSVRYPDIRFSEEEQRAGDDIVQAADAFLKPTVTVS